MPDNNLNTPPDEKEYSYNDLHKETTETIASNTELPKEPDKKVVEPVKEEKPAEKTEELDTNKLVEDVANKVVEKIAPPDEKKTEDQEYIDWANKFKEDEGKEPTWTDVAKHLKEEAIKAIDEREALKAKQTEETKKIADENEKRSIETFNKIVDEDLEDLYTNKKLTPIADKNNPSDQGVVERKALFQKMLDVNTQRATEGKRPIYSIKEIFYEHYTKPNAQPAGVDAPISMGKGTSPTGQEEQEIN